MINRWTLTGVVAVATLTTLAPAARAYTPIEFRGGPVISPVITPFFWGDTSSPPVIAYGGDANIYVMGIGTDGCLWGNTVSGNTSSMFATGICGMY